MAHWYQMNSGGGRIRGRDSCQLVEHSVEHSKDKCVNFQLLNTMRDLISGRFLVHTYSKGNMFPFGAEGRRVGR
jgi:hypothetical protein